MERSSAVVGLSLLVVLASAGVVPGTPAATAGPAAAATSAASTSNAPTGAVSGATTGYVVQAGAVPPSQTDNTTARLTIPSNRITRTGFVTVRMGLGTALQSGRDGARHVTERIRIERAFRAANTVKEKRVVTDQALIELEDQVKALAVSERAVIRAYNEGNITGERLVRELARIDSNAREIETTIQVLRNLVSRNDINVFNGRMMGVQFQAESLQGPVRHRVARTVAGDVALDRVFVTTSDTGVVLSALIGDTYVREATDYRYRRPDQPNTVTSPKDRAKAMYPWAWNKSGYRSTDGALTANIYRFSLTHPQGELVTYMDTGSAEIFHEIQSLTVEEMPTTSTVTRSGNGLRVTLERTYVGGPLDVLVEDAATGAVVNAEVTVDDHVLGRTGTDGHVRTIEPRRRYTVNVSSNGSSLSVTVDPDESEG